MLITLFGDLKWRDNKGLQQWLAAHDLKHQALAQALGRVRVPSPAFLLSAQINDEWLEMHATHHALLALQFAPDTNSSTANLTTDPNSDESAFYEWHNIHDLIHQRLDRALGITGT
jgi:hypothetical protein